MTDEKRLFRAINSNRKEEPEATFNYIYHKYKPLVIFIAAQYIKNEADIEDIVQETFIELFNDLESIKTTIRSYLTVCCKHNALDFLKKNKMISHEDNEVLLSYDDNPVSDYSELAYSGFNELINNMKNYLSEEDINIILLHLIDELKFDDIALKLNQNPRTIKTKYYRALDKYRKVKGAKKQ